MVMACLTISWALILLNKYKVVIHATSRVEFTPLFSIEGKGVKNTCKITVQVQCLGKDICLHLNI